jgi:cell division protease FtsH
MDYRAVDKQPDNTVDGCIGEIGQDMRRDTTKGERNKGFGLGRPDPDIEINKPLPRKLWQQAGFPFWVYLIFMLVSLWLWSSAEQATEREIPYSEFVAHLGKGEIKDAVVGDTTIRGTLTLVDPATKAPRRFVTVPLLDNELAKDLDAHGVSYSVRHENNWLSNFLLGWVLPFGFVFLLWTWIGRRMSGAARGFLNIGANRVHIHAATGTKVTFDDVAGADEAKEELKEVIEFLKDPTRIQRLGGRMPKGILLLGAPGTGKTLLARAVSGEAGVPFFDISGSEFIEMFVGVGAARVRELFEQAREKAPCIVFIDELDAIGGARGIGPRFGGHDEREQTLNQLLTEMDGFDPSSGVAVMAATNRPEILDKALLRAGRFDRQIVVDKPDLDARMAILALHAKKISLAGDVDLRVIAQRTPGFVGADLANITNEAAIRAVRKNHDAVTMADFEEAIDRIIAGPEKKHRPIGAVEKRRIAVHESGHALVASNVATAPPVHKVSIIPHGVAALGFTLQLPVEEKFLSTEAELKDQLTILLGGRGAEELVLGDVSSGAANDLERASDIARNMVTRLGMSARLGPLTYGKQQQLAFLGVTGQEERNFSDATAQLIDTEVKALVEAGQQRAHDILAANRAVLDALTAILIEREVIAGDELKQIVAAHRAS